MNERFGEGAVMKQLSLGVSLCLILLACPLAAAQTGESPQEALQGLLDLLKPALLEAVPHPLHERSYDWGRKSDTFHAVRWKGIKPQIVKTPKNDGTWRKVRLDTRNWPGCLKIQIHEVRQPDTEHFTFKIYLTFDVGVEMEQQNWENGIRLYAGSVRARLKIHTSLDCETTLKLDTSASFLPDLIVRMRVTKAHVWYDNLVVEHIAGIGGTGAKIIGELIHDSVNQWRPSLERRMLERANESIVRAADTREVRIGFGKLMAKKK